MELLLLLTALFASLTGGSSGERGLRQVQGVAVVRAAETVQAAVQPARAIPAVATIETMPREDARPAHADAPRPRAHLPFERRLE